MTIPVHVRQDELFLQATSFPPEDAFYANLTPDEIDERLRRVLHLASYATSTMTYVRNHLDAAAAAKAKAYEAIAVEARRAYLRDLARDVGGLIRSGAITVSSSRR